MPKGALLATMLLAAPLLTARVPIIEAQDLTTGQEVTCVPAKQGESVTLVFTHSMHGGDVRETFSTAGDGRLLRTEVTTANAAAAEYYASTANVTRVGDRFRIDVSPAAYDAVTVRVDRIGAHRLVAGGETIDLLAVAGDRHRVRLGVRTVAAWARLLGREC